MSSDYLMFLRTQNISISVINYSINFNLVLEHCGGGDLFHYLDRRDFKITEDIARNIAHQIATALYYLHSYGIAHRDLKLENILMCSNDDDTQLKLVDFGLSKMIGPNETTNDPFGTLVIFEFNLINDIVICGT